MGCCTRPSLHLVTPARRPPEIPATRVKYILQILLILLSGEAAAQSAATGASADTRAGVTGRSASNSTENTVEEWFSVTRVVDGDTFWVDDGSEKGLKVRLIGIDAPEPRNTGTRPKGYFGAESTSYLKQLLKDKKVRLEYDVSRYDRYGRTLAYAWLEDGIFVNAELVKNGFATVMTVPPNVKYQETFTELAAKARRQNRGLWKGDPSSL
ncbi:MAG: thermonuclease family protein [Bacteroidales bacterium]